MLNPLVLREMMVKQPCGHLEPGWLLFSGSVAIAHVPDFYAFMIGWMASDARRITIEPL